MYSGPRRLGKHRSLFSNWAKTSRLEPLKLRNHLALKGYATEYLFLERAEDGDYVILYTKARNLVESKCRI